jgi:membrane-bound lytic murein transglycosylase D
MVCLVSNHFVIGQNADSNNLSHNDLYYEYKLLHLNKTTPIPIDFHDDVKKYIEIYAKQRKDEFGRIIGQADYYFPIFETLLDKYQLPLELKYLSIVESGLNPVARSRSGALGLWQFKLNAGKMFDLTINSYIDERLDVYASTEAACKYFDYLYNTFNDWLLAISAYNGGPGVVRNAIERAGGNTHYWEIRKYMTEQTKNYVPAFIAAAYVMKHYQDHGITKKNIEVDFTNTDTLHIPYPVSFEQITEITGVTTEKLMALNPVYKLQFIPGDQLYTLVLPSSAISGYLRNETKIRAQKSSAPTYTELVRNAHNTDNKIKITHEVQQGEFFHKIALQYNCTIENLKAWNDLDSNALYPGQKLEVWIDPAHEDTFLHNEK